MKLWTTTLILVSIVLAVFVAQVQLAKLVHRKETRPAGCHLIRCWNVNEDSSLFEAADG
jgi:hypothetical protein